MKKKSFSSQIGKKKERIELSIHSLIYYFKFKFKRSFLMSFINSKKRSRQEAFENNNIIID